MRTRREIESEMAKNTNEIRAIDVAVSRRLILELLLDIRELLVKLKEA